MVFSSLEFLTLFLPAVLLLYFIAPGRLRNAVLLLGSLFFYAWGEPLYILLMLGSILANYVFGRLVGKFGRRRYIIVLTAVFNLGLLCVFKYLGFFTENLHALVSAVPVVSLALPIGISFFTFQAMSYVFDVYRGTARVQKNILNFALYISLFPQLIAGPIVRYADVAEQIDRRTVTVDGAASGAKRFIVGLSKKVLLANGAGAVFSAVTETSTAVPALSAWLAAAAYMLQIYFDFSGYSDMAIGLGKIFGFTFLENFDYPYISRSITEFWRRWHISLSTWFREYVYIPLGGNRRGSAKQVRNILVVWLLTGFWHGASWNFILWGLYYGLLLLIEKFVLGRVLERLPSAVRRVYTLVIVFFGWVLFAFDSTGTLFPFIGSLFGANGGADAQGLYLLSQNAVGLLVAAAACVPLWKNLAVKLEKRLPGRLFFVLELVFFLSLFAVCTAFLVAGTYNPFIYFRF
ncbi:MAG: MBOAT family protein [Clostridia bacterium]|nr:MBOAT family protein [Clostridia bacterium]